MKKFKFTPPLIGFLQTLGFVTYVGLLATFILNIGKIANNSHSPLGPTLAFSLFTFSAIICASLILAYPFYIFWEKKDFKTAAKIVAHSVLWLFIFILFVCLSLVIKL